MLCMHTYGSQYDMYVHMYATNALSQPPPPIVSFFKCIDLLFSGYSLRVLGLFRYRMSDLSISFHVGDSWE